MGNWVAAGFLLVDPLRNLWELKRSLVFAFNSQPAERLYVSELREAAPNLLVRGVDDFVLGAFPLEVHRATAMTPLDANNLRSLTIKQSVEAASLAVCLIPAGICRGFLVVLASVIVVTIHVIVCLLPAGAVAGRSLRIHSPGKHFGGADVM